MITTNTGAKKLEASDNWREIFPNPGTGTAGAHNASVDAQDRIQAEVAPIINGKQCALGAASGDYVLLRNSTITGKSDGAYIATKAIPANTDIDSTYLGNAITGGISNSLNNKITTLGNNSMYKADIAIAKGTTSNSAGLTNIDYPTGFTKNNCMITSWGVRVGTQWYVQDSRLIVIQEDDYLRFYITDSAFFDCPCYIAVQKHYGSLT